MKTLKFKTNIKCAGCIATVTPYINSIKEIETWEVNIADPNKILSVQTEKVNAEEIIKIIDKAGFKAEVA